MAINLFEGGNVFKLADGTPATTRIAKDNVVPTVQWLEQLTGLNLVDNMLGSTGRAETSGDLDLGIDASKVSKDTLINQLLSKGVANTDIRKSGDAVHYKAPILGDASNGFVQVDFMFTEDPAWQHFYMAGSGSGSKFKGVHRNVLLASIAKAQGLKFSPKFGLVSRETNEVISTDPGIIARTLFGGRASDLTSVESMLDAIKNKPNYDELINDFKDALAKDPSGPQLQERVEEGSSGWFRFMEQRLR